jgi:hypothetical protein
LQISLVLEIDKYLSTNVRLVEFYKPEIYTAEQLVPEQSLSGVHTASEKLKNYKFPGSDLLPEELIQADGRMLHIDT